MSIFNSTQEPLKVTLRIHDYRHIKSEQLYFDRFNRQFILSHGWNDIDVPIEEIRNAPRNRIMDLQAVKDVTIFASRLRTPKVIYIDDVRLVD